MDPSKAPPNPSTSPSHNIIRGTYTQLVVFLVLNMWTANLALPVLLGIILLKKIQRHATFINLILAFIVSGLSSSILAYAGKTTGPEPPKMLCLFQASLLYGMPTLTSSAAFLLVLQMFLVIRASYYGREMLDRDHVIRLWGMTIFPWVGYFVFVIVTAVVGALNPSSISRNRRFFYCSVESSPLTNVVTCVPAFFLLGTCILEVWTAVIFYKRWVAVRGRGSKLRWHMELNLPLRILGFGLYCIIALGLSLVSVKAPESPAPDLIVATAASFVVLIFGTQHDVLRALCFWRKTTTGSPSARSSMSESNLKSQLPPVQKSGRKWSWSRSKSSAV